MKIYVGSLNPVKINSVNEAVLPLFDDFSVVGVDSSSGVPDQPFDKNTYLGAKNRVLDILSRFHLEQNDLAIGIEGGIFHTFDRYIAKGVVCIGNNNGQLGFGESAGFELPEKVMKHINEGMELGTVIDQITGDYNTKKRGGAIGYLTDNLIDRTGLYRMGVIAAMIPLLNKKLYFD